MLPERGLLIAVSWRPAAILEPINVQLRGSAAANACFRLLKTSLNATTSDLYAETARPNTPLSRPPALHTSLSCPLRPSLLSSLWECFHLSLLQATCAQYHLHLEPYQTPSSPLRSSLPLSAPSHNMHRCLWVMRSAVCLVVCVTEERVRHVPLVVLVMCVPLMELIEDAPGHWSRISRFGFRRSSIVGIVCIITPHFEI